MNDVAAIRFENLSKSFGTTTAVEDLTLSVPGGCVFGFLGPNGAGKTTTIGCATGVLDPTAGTIAILGNPMGPNAVALKKCIGVMPDTLALFDALYVDELLSFQARMFGVSAADGARRVGDLVDGLGLGDELRKPLSALSAGMRKRVAFAAAIIHAPEILFLDEPFESVDPATVSLMKTWLTNMAGRGATIFLTSHVLESVERFCDRAAIVTSPGRLRWEGAVTRRDGFVAEDQHFTTLEDLYLHLCGRREARLEWL